MELPLKSVCAAAFLTYLPSQTEVVRARKLQEWAGFLGLEGFRLKYFMSTELTKRSMSLITNDVPFDVHPMAVGGSLSRIS